MKIDSGALKLPPTRVLFMHSSRIAARWGTNRTQLRAMLNSSQAEVQRLGETLAAKRPPAVADRITEIERYRQYLCGRSAAIAASTIF